MGRMSDLISRQAAIDEIEERKNANGYRNVAVISELNRLEGYIIRLPSIQKKGYTKADYIMALHKEYGCSLARAEESHQKALEYLRNMSMMKG